jgi:hypothetical protein
MDISSNARRRALGVLLLVASLAVTACSSPKATPAPPTTTAPPLVLQTDAAGKFRVEFPGTPTREETRQTVSGIDLLIVSFVAGTPTDNVVVAYTDYPTKNFDLTKVLDGAATGSAAKAGGTIQEKESTTFMGHPTIDLVIKSPAALVYERLVLRGSRLYTLVGVAVAGRSAAYDHLVGTFVLI